MDLTSLDEQPFRCPHCKHPRFLAGLQASQVAGTIRLPCPKGRHHVTFDLATGAIVDETVSHTDERELRCGACRGFLAGVRVTAGAGLVRIPCTKPRCKRHNTYRLKPERQPHVAVPTG